MWRYCGEFYEPRSGLEKFECTDCGEKVILYFGKKYPNYCPNCGRKQVEDAEHDRMYKDNGSGFMLIPTRERD